MALDLLPFLTCWFRACSDFFGDLAFELELTDFSRLSDERYQVFLCFPQPYCNLSEHKEEEKETEVPSGNRLSKQLRRNWDCENETFNAHASTEFCFPFNNI